jgi:hypothetical protein
MAIVAVGCKLRICAYQRLKSYSCFLPLGPSPFAPSRRPRARRPGFFVPQELGAPRLFRSLAPINLDLAGVTLSLDPDARRAVEGDRCAGCFLQWKLRDTPPPFWGTSPPRGYTPLPTWGTPVPRGESPPPSGTSLPQLGRPLSLPGGPLYLVGGPLPREFHGLPKPVC